MSLVTNPIPMAQQQQSKSETVLADEKALSGADSQGSRSDVERPELDWTEKEERALVRKIDLLVMPLLMLGFFALQLDRGNM